ncbi:MAG: C40 family peptidase [Rhodoplanes sp.]|uniref:NlpC/P60 family protein n=1 Tax=Rhodoplanes sp. TaxID=1968906 RepID=UPI0017BBF8D2|nr:NlpC/P60 family protein [Rhodoplanes sp.]NVO13911.1 C40 family peptidase [Rhodoplanes sp.]
MFNPDVEIAARRHAIAEYPRECVGFVLDGVYAPQLNLSETPERNYTLAADAWSDDIEAVIHSHPGGTCSPSRADMQSQASADIPYGITVTDGADATPIVWFGDSVLDEPLVGRPFLENVTDCFELGRAYFWQAQRIWIPPFPRDPTWWEDGGDLITENLRRAGFAPVEAPTPGDVLLIGPAGRLNHIAILLDGNLMLHHRAGQLSRREPWSGAWRRLTRSIVRHDNGTAP